MHTTRSNQWFWNRNKKDANASPESSIEKQIGGTRDVRKKLMERLSTRLEGPSIFEDEAKATGDAASEAADAHLEGPEKADAKRQRRAPGAYTKAGASLVKEHLSRAVDPDPRSRVRWERKMVMRAVRNGTNPFSKEPRKLRIARTEREVSSKSPWLATSVKKLVHLSRQIAGKPLDEALVQMRYSNKKMAREVKVQLELARDLAIAERGMGLGEINGEVLHPSQAIKIQTKKGKHVEITDPTRMYVAESWVNRGPWRAKVPSYRARGNIHMLMKPSTSISIVLKEEKTRIREHQERVAKKQRQRVWVHLPDRPITAQRPYYSW
ncbi:ribosomal protein L22/L17 [Lasiosphaeria miniovina]|uniref:Ribosomal protein L22/L17 n=1 Tax=Lasiosphaeria miniovina TaxID=1954250 RepID=A0AA40E965_9PEZI|nr:ribosomal protein L22/L17 [Lasiosphaeria miniovina]KAK0732979.1 ribosomal protein L22/L17 [Lasiosphaeria miniovina]